MNKDTGKVTYETKNYDQFKTLEGNRSIDQKNVNNIEQNMREHGVLPTVIIVNEKMEVIDGQHRIEALKRLHEPVRFQIHEGLTVKDCIGFNIASVNWKIKDYIKSYSLCEDANIKKEYIGLEKLKMEFPDISDTALSVYASGLTGDKNKVQQRIRNGEFKFLHSYEETVEKLNFLNRFNEFDHYGGNYTMILDVINNIYEFQKKGFLKGLNLEFLHSQFAKYYNSFYKVHNKQEAMDVTLNIYNKRRREKISEDLFKHNYKNVLYGKMINVQKGREKRYALN